MAKILYDNKSYLNQNANIPNANKVCDSDMNEIKSVVNSNYDEEKADIESFFYKVGDVVEIGSTNLDNAISLSGYISGSSKNVFVSIILPKRLDNINTIVVNNFNVESRGINGFLNSQSGYVEYSNLSGYTLSAAKCSNNGITIKLVKSTAFSNATTNTPLCLNGYIKITLS